MVLTLTRAAEESEKVQTENCPNILLNRMHWYILIRHHYNGSGVKSDPRGLKMRSSDELDPQLDTSL